MRKNLTAIILLGLLLALVSIIAISEASSSSPKLYVDPLEIIDPALAPGLSFSVNITVVDVVDLSSYEFNMSYDKDILACKGISVGPDENLPTPNWKVIDGIIWMKTIYGIPVTSEAPVTVATLEFKVQGRGASFLNFTYTSLNDSLGQPILHEASGGYFQNYLLGDLNDDGIVDMRDIGIACSAFGSWPEHPRWNPIADLNSDDLVDMRDIAIICFNLGK